MENEFETWNVTHTENNLFAKMHYDKTVFKNKIILEIQMCWSN